MEDKKNIFKDIKEKTAGMSFRDKADYMWEYYRIHFLVIIFAAVCVISITVSVVTNALSDPVLSCGVTSEVQAYSNNRLEDAIESTFPESTGFQKPVLFSVTSPANEDRTAYSATQLIALLNTQELDCFICDEESLEQVERSEYPVEITELTDSRLGEFAKSLNIPKLYYVVFMDSEHADEARKFLETVKELNLDE